MVVNPFTEFFLDFTVFLPPQPLLLTIALASLLRFVVIELSLYGDSIRAVKTHIIHYNTFETKLQQFSQNFF